MNYSENPGHVRLDRFKGSGKWYDTHVLNMEHHYLDSFLYKAIMKAMIKQDIKLDQEWFAVILEPYHKNAHPYVITQREYDFYKTTGKLR